MIFREGREADAAAIAQMEKDIFSDAWSDLQVRSHLESGCGRTYVCEADGRIVGYLLGSLVPPEGEILRVAVLPEMRGRRFAEHLISLLTAELSVCFLEVREGNASARRLYERLGFRPIGKRDRYYKNPTEDACLYRLDT